MPHLRFFQDISVSFCPLVTILGIFESLEQGATFAFGFMKKYLFSKKLEHKTFCCIFFITRFPKNIFRKIFSKNRNFRFFKKLIFQICLKFIFFSEKYFLKNRNFNFSKIFSMFFNRVMKNIQQNVLCSNFFENKYFFMNPKVKVVSCSKVSKMHKHFTNEQKLATLSPKNRRGYI